MFKTLKMANTTYETIGRVQQIMPEQVISEKMKKRNLVIETNEQYPQLLQLEAVNDNCSRLDNLKAGDEVKVEFQVRGRKWQDKILHTLQIWRILKTQR